MGEIRLPNEYRSHRLPLDRVRHLRFEGIGLYYLTINGLHISTIYEGTEVNLVDIMTAYFDSPQRNLCKSYSNPRRDALSLQEAEVYLHPMEGGYIRPGSRILVA